MNNFKILKNITKCRICFSNQIQLVLKLNKTPIGEDFRKKKNTNPKKYDLDLYQCKNCGLAQLKQVINPYVLYKNYLYQSSSSVDLDSHFKNYSKTVLKYLKIKNKTIIVDIGSNDGSLLKHFKKLKHTVIGIEPAKKIANIANKKNILTINSFFNKSIALKIIKKYGYPSVVTANNVLANVDDVGAWLKNIKTLIQDRGIFVFESFALLDVVKNKVVDFIYHEHLSIFSVKSAMEMCRAYDLKLIHVQRVNTKGGSFRYYISSLKNSININKSVANILNLELKNKIYSKKTFLNLSSLIDKNKKLLKVKIDQALKKNKILIGVGASISCITLMYQLNLQKKIKYLIDDNKIKNRMYSPGANIKVINTAEFIFHKNYNYILLAWRFKKNILSRHKKHMKGDIISAWPEVKYIKNHS
jgi:hypothetical protein